MLGILPWWVIFRDDFCHSLETESFSCDVSSCQGKSLWIAPSIPELQVWQPPTYLSSLPLSLSYSFLTLSHPTVSKRSKDSTFSFHLSNNTLHLGNEGASNFLFLVKFGRSFVGSVLRRSKEIQSFLSSQKWRLKFKASSGIFHLIPIYLILSVRVMTTENIFPCTENLFVWNLLIMEVCGQLLNFGNYVTM